MRTMMKTRDEDDEDESGYEILVVNYIAKDGGASMQVRVNLAPGGFRIPFTG